MLAFLHMGGMWLKSVRGHLSDGAVVGEADGSGVGSAVGPADGLAEGLQSNNQTPVWVPPPSQQEATVRDPGFGLGSGLRGQGSDLALRIREHDSRVAAARLRVHRKQCYRLSTPRFLAGPPGRSPPVPRLLYPDWAPPG
jgi:hypothetical protein